MDDAIRISGLVKTFGSKRALDGLELAVGTGEVHGLLGPNGAGKTTTIRVLLGLLRADAGEVRLLGGDPWHDSVRLNRRLAYVPGDVYLWPNLSGGEAIDLLGTLRGSLDRRRREALIDRFQLDPTKRCRTYSKGNRQKVAIIAALSSDVELYLLDEPTAGLDPLMSEIFEITLREFRADGRTVVLASHILAEVEALCDRVSIVREGRTVESGTLAELRHLTRISVVVEADQELDLLRSVPGVHDLELEDLMARFQVDSEAIGEVIRALATVGIRSLTSTPPTLEALFLRHYDDHPVGREQAS